MAKGAIVIKIGDEEIARENFLDTEEKLRNYLYEECMRLVREYAGTSSVLSGISVKYDPNYPWGESEN